MPVPNGVAGRMVNVSTFYILMKCASPCTLAENLIFWRRVHNFRLLAETADESKRMQFLAELLEICDQHIGVNAEQEVLTELRKFSKLRG